MIKNYLISRINKKFTKMGCVACVYEDHIDKLMKNSLSNTYLPYETRVDIYVSCPRNQRCRAKTLGKISESSLVLRRKYSKVD